MLYKQNTVYNFSFVYPLKWLKRRYHRGPPVRGSAEGAGTVSEEFHEKTGLPAGIPVLGGLFDVNSCMLGAGAVDASRFSMTAGTWGINAIPSAAPVRSESITQCCRFYGGLPYVCIDSAPTSCAESEKIIEHLKDLGITHIQILPSFDYAQTNDDESYNWGYNPYNYNVPEGRYVKVDDTLKAAIDAYYEQYGAE